MARRRSSFGAELKREVVLELLAGATSAAALCRRYELSPHSLMAWKKAFEKGGLERLCRHGLSCGTGALTATARAWISSSVGGGKGTNVNNPSSASTQSPSRTLTLRGADRTRPRAGLQHAEDPARPGRGGVRVLAPVAIPRER